jgi:hypothetical protein
VAERAIKFLPGKIVKVEDGTPRERQRQAVALVLVDY